MNWLELLVFSYESHFRFKAEGLLGLTPRFGERSISFYVSLVFVLLFYAIAVMILSIIFGQSLSLGLGPEILLVLVAINIPPFNAIPYGILYRRNK